MALDWTLADDIALLLQETYPDVNPQSLKFAELADMLKLLPGAPTDFGPLDEKILEAIQAAWFEEYEGDQA